MYGFQVSRAAISRLRVAISSSAGVGDWPNSSSHSGMRPGVVDGQLAELGRASE